MEVEHYIDGIYMTAEEAEQYYLLKNIQSSIMKKDLQVCNYIKNRESILQVGG
jgi:hypothetical protein